MKTIATPIVLIAFLTLTACDDRPAAPPLTDSAVLVLGEDGSGGSAFVVVAPDGRRVIVTAEHVVCASDRPWVELRLKGDGGRSYRTRVRARVTWSSRDHDLAILTVEPGVPIDRVPAIAMSSPGAEAGPYRLVGFTTDAVTGDVTDAVEVRVNITQRDIDVPLPDDLLGTRRTCAGHAATAPGAGHGFSGGPVVDARGVLIGVLSMGVEGDDAVGIVSPAPLVDGIVRALAAPPPATREALAAATADALDIIAPTWAAIRAAEQGDDAGDLAALDKLPPAEELLGAGDLAAIRNEIGAAARTREGARQTRLLALLTMAWTLDGALADPAARPEVLQIRRHRDDVVEADLALGSTQRALVFRREAGAWGLSLRGLDGAAYPWAADSHWAYGRARGFWSGRTPDGTHTFEVVTVTDGPRVRGGLRLRGGDFDCTIALSARIAAGDERMSFTLGERIGTCPSITALELADLTAARVRLGVELDGEPHSLTLDPVEA